MPSERDLQVLEGYCLLPSASKILLSVIVYLTLNCIVFLSALRTYTRVARGMMNGVINDGIIGQITVSCLSPRSPQPLVFGMTLKGAPAWAQLSPFQHSVLLERLLRHEWGLWMTSDSRERALDSSLTALEERHRSITYTLYLAASILCTRANHASSQSDATPRTRCCIASSRLTVPTFGSDTITSHMTFTSPLQIAATYRPSCCTQAKCQLQHAPPT